MGNWVAIGVIASILIQVISVIFNAGRYSGAIKDHGIQLNKHDGILNQHAIWHAELRGYQRGREEERRVLEEVGHGSGN